MKGIQSSFFCIFTILIISIFMIEKDFKKFITDSLKEDIGDGDHSSYIYPKRRKKQKLHLIVKDEGIIWIRTC